jgi:hypothetical protein
MSFSVAIATIVLLDLALIAGLAYAMSRPTRLAPHVSRRRGGAASTASAAR